MNGKSVTRQFSSLLPAATSRKELTIHIGKRLFAYVYGIAKDRVCGHVFSRQKNRQLNVSMAGCGMNITVDIIFPRRHL
jgi:hypothetical protein